MYILVLAYDSSRLIYIGIFEKINVANRVCIYATVEIPKETITKAFLVHSF